MQTYIRILKLLPPYKVPFALAFACMVAFALSNGAMVYLIGPVMKFLFTNSGEASATSINVIPFDIFSIPREKMMLGIPLAIIAVAVVKGVSSYGQSFFMGFVGQGVVKDLRGRLYDRVLNLPVDYFANTSTGVLISRLTNDVNLLQTSTADAITVVLKQSLTILVLAVVIITLDWKLAIAASVALPLSVYPMRKLGKKIKNISTKGQISMGDMTSLLHEAIGGGKKRKGCLPVGGAGERGREGEQSERSRP